MNSILGERVQGFLKRRSVLHSVEWRLNSGVTPASSSSHFSIGVTSTATVGPKLELPSVRLRSAAPPSSTTATSFSVDCAKTFPAQRSKDAINMNPEAPTPGPLSFVNLSIVASSGYAKPAPCGSEPSSHSSRECTLHVGPSQRVAIGFPPIKQPLASEAAALAFGCPRKMGHKKEKNSCRTY